MKKAAAFFRNSFKEDAGKRSYYFVYTVFFCITAFFCFSWFIFSDRSFIYDHDAWNQHFKALVYYAKYLRQIIRHLLYDHKLVIPDWDFYIAEGSDVVNALHYYVIGDPIALLSVFVPTRYMQYFYSFSCVLRIYLGGTAFSALCFGTGKKNRYGILAGALAYSFCSWALFACARHPYFLNPMIYFPLVILGIEKIIKREKPYLFILTAAVSAASNFYFFYQIVLLTVLYTVIRLIILYGKKIKKGILTLLRIGLMAVIGVGIACILFLPVLSVFLQDSRLSASQPFHLFYSLGYYSRLPSVAVSSEEEKWLLMGYAVPVILAVFLLFFRRRKEDRILRILFISGIIMIVFPIFGRILNGMSYMTNRWSWAFALLCAYIFAAEWEGLLSLSKKNWTQLVAGSLVFYAACLLLDRSRTDQALSAVPAFFIILILLRENGAFHRKPVRMQYLMIAMTVLGAVNVAFWLYAPGGGNYIATCKENKKIWDEWSQNEIRAVKNVSDYEYTRITGKNLTRNANITGKISSTQYFWSLSNPHVNAFREDLSMRELPFYKYYGYDDRTTPITLSGVQYYVTEGDDELVPYGFSKAATRSVAALSRERRIEQLRKELGTDRLTKAQREKITSPATTHYTIYKNDYALPLGYCYDSVISKETWDSLNPVQKQEVQLESAYVDSDVEGIDSVNPDLPDYTVSFDSECSGTEVTPIENGFVTTADNTSVVLTLHGNAAGAETYIGFEGFKYKKTPEYDLYFGDESVDPLNLYNKTNWEMKSKNSQISARREKIFWSPVNNVTLTVKDSAGVKKTVEYLQPDAQFSSGRDSFIVNFGYSKEPVTTITIIFPEPGIYTFDSIKAYCVPMEGYAEKVSGLKEHTLQDISLGTDTVTGTITLDRTRMLCLATPYSKGWKAYIDGTETEVYCLNDRYLGIVIPSGEHAIRFRYHMPYKREGFMISLIGIGAFIVLVICERKHEKKKQKEGVSQ